MCPTCSKSRYNEWSHTFHHGNSETYHIINAAASSSRNVFNACMRTEKMTMVIVQVCHRVRVGVRHQTHRQHAPGRVRRSTILLCIRGCQRCIKSGGSPVIRLLERAHTKRSREVMITHYFERFEHQLNLLRCRYLQVERLANF